MHIHENKHLLTIIILIGIAISGIAYFIYKVNPIGSATTSVAKNIPRPEITAPVVPEQNQTTPAFTVAEVGKHADANSCYSIINDGVYDLTKWISVHPGGAQRILDICGKDGSIAFNKQHGFSKKIMNAVLPRFKVGNLQK